MSSLSIDDKKALEKIIALLEKIYELSVKTGELISNNDTEKLLDILDEKQHLIDEIDTLRFDFENSENDQLLKKRKELLQKIKHLEEKNQKLAQKKQKEILKLVGIHKNMQSYFPAKKENGYYIDTKK